MGAMESRTSTIVPAGWDPFRGRPRDNSASILGVCNYRCDPDEFLLLYVGWLYDFSGLREFGALNWPTDVPRPRSGQRAWSSETATCCYETRSGSGSSSVLGDRLMLLGRRPLS